MKVSERALGLGVALAGAAWGLFWIPMRALQAAGLAGVWAALALFTAGALVLAPALLWRRRALRWHGAGWLITGALTGAAFALYATALLFTDVVHTLLLFYLTPLWSTVLERLLLGEPLTRTRAVALLMGLAGLAVVLGYRHGWPLPRNAGDWMALLSGILWSYGTLRVFAERHASVVQPLAACQLGALGLAALLPLLPAVQSGPPPAPAVWLDALPLLLAMNAAYLLPTIAVILLGAARLSPGRVGLLLMGEALVGVASAAWLAGEPFALREALGSLLILGAGSIEVLGTAAGKARAQA